MTDPCSKMRDKIADRLLGASSGEQDTAIEQHISACPKCTLYALALEEQRSVLEQFGRRLDAGMQAREDRVIEALNRAVSCKTAQTGSLWRTVLRSPIIRFAAAAIVIVALLAAVKLLTKNESKPGEPPTIADKHEQDLDGTANDRRLAQKLASELKTIDQMFAASDIDGLVEMLETGEWKSKIAAAGCLAKMGDSRAIEALSSLAEQWRGDDGENPFKQAMQEIQTRLESQETTPEPPQEQTQSSQRQREFKLRGVLSGVIIDANTAEPIPDVGVRIYCRDHGEQHQTTTDSNGVYSFKAIAKDGPYTVSLEAAEHITVDGWKGSEETVQLKRGAQFVKHFELERGGKINIRVVDEQGRPIKRVTFHAAYVSDEMGRGPKDTFRSDEKGITSIGRLRPSAYWITAWHGDYALAGRKVVLEEPLQVKSVVFEMKKGIEIAGKAVCSDGLPAGGFGIEAKPIWWHSGSSPSDLRISEDGTFLLPHIVPGLHRIGLSIPHDGGSTGMWSIDVNLPPADGFLELDIPEPSLHNRVSISGTLNYVGGESGSGVWLSARSDAGHYGSVYVPRGQTSFVIENLVPDLYTIDFSLDGGERKTYRNIKAPSEGLVIEIPAKKQFWLTGAVVDKETGDPVTDFRVKLWGTTNWQQISDPNGRFNIRASAEGCQKVMVAADGYAEKTSAEICPDANEAVVIVLGIPGAIEGRVVNEDSEPILGAKISFKYKCSADDKPEDKYITSTGADGKFVIEGLSGDSQSNWFEIVHPDYAPVCRYIDAEEGHIIETEIVLSEGGSVEGYVYDWLGRPLAETILYFLDDSSYEYWERNQGRLGSAVTDSNGFYRLERLPEKLCYVFREDPQKLCYALEGDPQTQLGVVSTAVLPRQGETRRLDIGGKWRTTGRLLENGRPVANCNMLIKYDAVYQQAFSAFGLSDSDGRFAFYGIPVGRWTLYFAVPGIRGWEKYASLGSFEFESGEDLELGDLDVILGQVTVELRPEDPCESADQWHVSIQQFNEKLFWGRRAGKPEPRSGALDPYIFSGLVPGKYEAIAERDNYPTIRRVFEIGPGRSTQKLDVTIPVGSASLAGRIIWRDPKNSAPQLMLRSSDAAITMPIRQAGDGSYRMENLPAGDYAIGLASVATSRTSTVQEVTLLGGEDKDLDVAVAADSGKGYNGYLVVLVVTHDGLLLPGTRVWLEGQGRIVEPHFDTDDGKSFGVDAGTYTLRAEYPGYRAIRQSVEVKSKEGRNMQQILKPLVITMVKQ